jgi:hypothetical protein
MRNEASCELGASIFSLSSKSKYMSEEEEALLIYIEKELEMMEVLNTFGIPYY